MVSDPKRYSYARELTRDLLIKSGLREPAVGLYVRARRVGEVPRKVYGRILRLKEALSGVPVPPPDLLYLVAGTTDVHWFLHAGKLAYESIRSALRGETQGELGKVLDFGCGCGRVLRYWRTANGVQLFGTDYNPLLVEWCRRNLSFANYSVNDLSPPLAYPDNEFDVVYALSVFTHLPEQLQLSWMDELRRVIKPGGFLLITLHGDAYVEYLHPAELEAYRNDQLVVKDAEAAGSNRCSAYHTETYVRGTLAKGFDVVKYIPEGAKGNPKQDLYLLRKV